MPHRRNTSAEMKLIFGPFSVFPPQERKKEKNQQHQQINLYISPFLMQIRTQLFWVNLSSGTHKLKTEHLCC